MGMISIKYGYSVKIGIAMIDWEQVRIDAAISAMQGVLESGKLGMVLEASPDTVARQAVRMADALVEKLKGEK